MFKTLLAIFAGFGLLCGGTGCYQRVVSERPFPGMAATRTETAPDYAQAQADFERRVEKQNQEPFDPIGNWIINPLAGAAKSIGNAFSGGDDKEDPAKPGTNPPRPATSPADVAGSRDNDNAPADRRAPADTAP